MKKLFVFFGGILFTIFILIPVLLLSTGLVGRLHEKCGKCRVAGYAIEDLGVALSLYANDFEDYPSEDEGLAVLKGKYIPELPLDGWGRNLQYAIYESNGQKCFLVWSYGSDGVSGGKKDIDRDIFANHERGNCLTKLSN